MFLCMRLFVILNVFTALHATAAVTALNGWPGVYQDLEWRAQMCCVLISNGKVNEAGASSSVYYQSLGHVERNLHQYQCRIQNSTNATEDSSTCHVVPDIIHLDIRCWLKDKQANVTCNIKLQRATARGSNELIISLWREVPDSDETNITTPVQCPGRDEITCDLALQSNCGSVSLSVRGLISGCPLLAPEMHISTDLLRKPDAPFHLHYNVTTAGEVMIAWNDSQNNKHPLYYELRYSSNTSLAHWEVLNVQHPWAFLSEFTSRVRYKVQVRCRSLHHVHYWSEWSDWSQPFFLTLDVSCIPAEVVTRPGEEVTVYGVFHNHSWTASKAVWMLNDQILPRSQYRMINERVSAVAIRSKEPDINTLMCCYPWGERYKCGIAYAKVYVEGFFDANITCQTDQSSRVDLMTCKWKKSAWALIRFMYRRYRQMCPETPYEEGTVTQTHEETMAGVEECPDGAGDYHECTLRDLSLFSCYKLWLVVEGGYNKVRSRPVFVSPIDYVKPSPPSDVEALTLPNKTLSITWKRPQLPAYELQYELRYVPTHGMADLHWKLFGPLLEAQAAVLVQDPCIQYKIEVRCRRFNGSGYWSDWSEAEVSSVYSIKAPEMGPDFWRIIHETPAGYSNVTLLFKPLPSEEPVSCVQSFVVVHQTSGGTVWSDDVAPSSSYTFQWSEEVHSITVMSRNPLGSSARNNNMTLFSQLKRQCVRWFQIAANASCVFLSWNLVCEQPLVLSFVLEWQELNGDYRQGWTSAERVKWLRVASTARDLQLCRPLYGTEEFKLYPVFVDGEGEPVICTAVRRDPAAFMLLMIIAFLFVVLFVTLIISQNQLKKLMWKDVPNPNNCSWAKGKDFKKLDGNLFGHQEGLTACPLLPMSESVCEVEIVEKLCVLEEDPEVKALLHHSIDAEDQSTLSFIEGSLDPLSLDMSTVAATTESSGQSSVMYSTILVFNQPVLQRKQQESLSSDEGNFSANNSDISGSFPGGLFELESHSSSGDANPRNSGSYNSVEEFSETSEQEDEASESTQVCKELYYLGMDKEEEEDELEEGFKEEYATEEPIPDSSLELECKNLKADSDTSVPVYLPQFRTAAVKLLRETGRDSAIQL